MNLRIIELVFQFLSLIYNFKYKIFTLILFRNHSHPFIALLFEAHGSALVSLNLVYIIMQTHFNNASLSLLSLRYSHNYLMMLAYITGITKVALEININLFQIHC